MTKLYLFGILDINHTDDCAGWEKGWEKTNFQINSCLKK